MNGVPYKDTFAAKGSQLHEALANKDVKAAKAIHEDTTRRFDALYPAGDRQWFENLERTLHENPHAPGRLR